MVLASFIAGLVVGMGLMRLRYHYRLVAERERCKRRERIAFLVAVKAFAPHYLASVPGRTNHCRPPLMPTE